MSSRNWEANCWCSVSLPVVLLLLFSPLTSWILDSGFVSLGNSASVAKVTGLRQWESEAESDSVRGLDEAGPSCRWSRVHGVSLTHVCIEKPAAFSIDHLLEPVDFGKSKPAHIIWNGTMEKLFGELLLIFQVLQNSFEPLHLHGVINSKWSVKILEKSWVMWLEYETWLSLKVQFVRVGPSSFMMTFRT